MNKQRVLRNELVPTQSKQNTALKNQVTKLQLHIKHLDDVLDEEGIAVSCINGPEDLRNAIRALKAKIPSTTVADPYDADHEEVTGSRYYVVHRPTYTFTAIGAENGHHAFNKATKLFDGKWTSLGTKEPSAEKWKYLDLPSFTSLVKNFNPEKDGL